MIWFDGMIEKALSDPYLDDLLVKAELCYSCSFLNVAGDDRSAALSEKEFYDILRFADILCRSKTADGRNKAYKIISLLYDFYKSDPFFQYCADTVLTKLGIFPTLSLLSNDSIVHSNTEVALEKTVKETYQISPFEGKVFTDAQYRLFEKLKNSNHYSFSGTTSFGKSFVMEAFINHIIKERNASDNIAILVPTRALINQVSAKLKLEITNRKYKVLKHPVVPPMYRARDYRYVFVFTPERWISYISENTNPVITYMFIDEAHKVVSQKDSRAPLYYHAILLAERKSVNLFFASPNIPNAEVFLQLFEKSQDESMVIYDSPVAQNRYYIDFIEKRAILFSDTGKEITLPYDTSPKQGFLRHLLIELGNGYQNIVYCNTIDDTINLSLEFSQKLPIKENAQINELIKLIKSFVHKDYYLIDCLQHGVAFHFGRLPQRIREQVESLFAEGIIDYIFCTSTLLEGVNLPAKNIFILNNAIGMSKFSDIDFWNLAGRAGRLSKEMSGNIICVRAEEKKNRWDNPAKDLDVVRSKKISNISPSVIKGEKNFYTNLGNAIQGTPFTNKNASQTQKEIWNHYSNILYIHQIGKSDSILINNFLKKNIKAKQILEDVSKSNEIPLSILEQCSTIKPKYQNALWQSSQLEPLPYEVSRDSCQSILDRLYDSYNWKSEESGGRNPMVHERARLQYFSNLMYSWIQGTPLNMIINNLIQYYKGKGQIFHQGNYVEFDDKSKAHINIIINNLMSDIDTALRFKIKNYLLNYSLICSKRLGKKDNSVNWVDYLEFGTTDPLIIELQTLGMPRHLAYFIIQHHNKCLELKNGSVINFDDQRLQQEINQKEYAVEYKELANIFDWDM